MSRRGAWCRAAALGLSLVLGSALPVSAQQMGWLGASLEDVVSKEIAGPLRPDGRIIRVVMVADGGPAAAAGLAKDDYILGLNGVPTKTSAAFVEDIWLMMPGVSASLEIVRDGKRQALQAKIAARPPDPDPAKARLDSANELLRLLTFMIDANKEPWRRIRTAEAALKLVPQFDTWPFNEPRERVLHGVWFQLGHTYLIHDSPTIGKQWRLEAANNALREAVRIPVADPNAWAETHYFLGMSYSSLARALRERSGNEADRTPQYQHYLAELITALNEALTVHTLAADPGRHQAANEMLADAFAELNEPAKALAAIAKAVRAQDLQTALSDSEENDRNRISPTRRAFERAIVLALKAGDNERAFDLLDEDRLRQTRASFGYTLNELAANEMPLLRQLRADYKRVRAALAADSVPNRTELLQQLDAHTARLLAIADRMARVGPAKQDVRAAALSLIGDGGAIVAPLVAYEAGKIFIATVKQGKLVVAVLDAPQLTFRDLLRFNAGEFETSGFRFIDEPKLKAFEQRNKRMPRFGWNATLIGQSGGGLPEDDDWKTDSWLRGVANIGPELGDYFGRLIQKGLEDQGVRPGAHVFWLPTGELGVMPFGLTLTAAGGRPFNEIYEISYAASISALAAAKGRLASLPRPSLASIVNPTADLEFAEIEGQLVATHFSAPDRSVLLREAATPGAVTSALKDRTYWHFASHGAFKWGEPRQSALFMSENVPLTVEALGKGRDLNATRLVVLSACQTGLIDDARAPGALVGLPGAFLALGSVGVIGSLWQVDDRATALLMAKFYDFHFGRGLRPSAALKAAQLWLRDATRRDLLAYARSLGDERRLEPRYGERLEAGLARGARVDKRFAAVWKRTQMASGGGMSSTRTQPDSDGSASDDERPFSHPHYWGGFVHMGL